MAEYRCEHWKEEVIVFEIRREEERHLRVMSGDPDRSSRDNGEAWRDNVTAVPGLV